MIPGFILIVLTFRKTHIQNLVNEKKYVEVRKRQERPVALWGVSIYFVLLSIIIGITLVIGGYHPLIVNFMYLAFLINLLPLLGLIRVKS